MPQIIPAILEKTKEGFDKKLGMVTKIPGVEKIQVDFADGIFVPNALLEVAKLDPLNPAFEWEAHLMVKSPTDFFDYEICGFKTIIIHYEAFNSEENILISIGSIKNLGLEPGICINSGTPVEVLKKFEKEVKRFQLMSIIPGFQGQPFLENTFERVAELRKLIPGAAIEVDGGVNIANVGKLAESGVDMVTVGSALLTAQNPASYFEKLIQEAQRG